MAGRGALSQRKRMDCHHPSLKGANMWSLRHLRTRLTTDFPWGAVRSRYYSSLKSEYDFIIVGGGTAGCLLANRLSSDPSRRVLLVEAGSGSDSLRTRIPIGYLYCIGNPKTDWMFSTEIEKGLGNRQLTYPRGRVLGGCSAINGMLYLRGNATDYDRWAKVSGDPSWSWKEVLPLFKAFEDHGVLPSSEYHGYNGEWRVEKQRLHWDILDAWKNAAVESGIPEIDDFNSGCNEGVSYFHVNQKKGWRWHAASAFLSPAIRSRPQLDVISDATVEKLLLHPQGSRVVGLQLREGQQPGKDSRRQVNIAGNGQVIMSAGAIGTPHLMQISGIGDPELLSDVGIPCAVPLAGVGANLQDHLQIRTVFKVKNTKTLNEMSRSWLGRLSMGVEYLLHQSGPLSMAPSQLGAFSHVASHPDQSSPNVEYHIQPLSLEKFGEPLHPYPAITASICNLRPTSRGFVRATSASIDAPPKIAPHYLSTEEDRVVAADCIRLTRKIMEQPALEPFQPSEVKPGPKHVTTEVCFAYVSPEASKDIFLF
jgi:choline dehydrogenase